MPRLAYLLGASHSGSTLLAMALGAHPEACSVGELKATSLLDSSQYRCSCKQLIRECYFWKRVRSEMERRGVPDFDITRAGTSIHEVKSSYARKLLAPLHRGPVLELLRDAALSLSPAWRKHAKTAGKRNVALMESILAITGGKTIVDSSKIALRLKYLMQLPKVDVRVIRVIRDGRSVSVTYCDDWNFADSSDPTFRGGGNGRKPDRPQRSMTEAAIQWKRSNEAADALVSRLLQSHWMQVRYEDLCADPGRILREISSFLGIDPSKVTLDFRSPEQHVIGNGMRLDSSATIALDERWKEHITQDQRDTFERIAGSLNRKYGYS